MNIPVLEKIKSLMSETGTISLQSYHFLNLDLVEKVTGESWPKLRQKIFWITENFLNKRLSHDDLIIKLHDGFLIIFAHINNREAAKVGKHLGDDINRFFIGDETFKNVQMVTKHSEVNAKKLHKKIIEIKQAARDSSSDKPAIKDNNAPYWQSEILDKLTLFYRPIWDISNEIISSNSCIPLLDAHGHQHFGRDVMIGDTSLEFLHNLDILMLRHSQDIMMNLASIKKYCVITVTVSYLTLRDKASRIEYFNQLSETPERLRKFFFVCVDQIPAGVPQGKLIEIFRTLGTLCGATLVHNLPSSIRFDSFIACGIKLFGFSMHEFMNHEHKFTNEHIDLISFFCSHAHKQKAMVYVTEIDKLDYITPLAKAGVRYFSGRCIGQSSTAPMLPSTLHAKNIFTP